MLAFRAGWADLELEEVAPYLLDQARDRKGHWRVVVYNRHADPYSVVFTEEEYSKLSRTMYHGYRNNTKVTSMHAGLENAAQTLWPTGSLDHVAMRHVGVSVVMQYITNRANRQGLWGYVWTVLTFIMEMLACYYGLSFAFGWKGRIATAAIAYWRKPGKRSQLPELHRITKDPANSIWLGPGPSTEAKTGGDPPSNGAPIRVEPTPPKLDAPSTPDDDANGAEATEDGRTIVRGEVVAVVGQNFDKSEPINHMPVVGLMVGPCQTKPNVYSKTASNLQAAIEERINKKAKKPQITKADKARIGKVVHASMSCNRTRGVFSRARVAEWAIQNFDLEACKSGKWSLQRFRGSLENLYAKEHPRYAFKADIKYECMPEGKAPRMLIADGDEGQLMALAVVKCFEDLLFHHFEERSIKHASKKDAMDRVVNNLKRPGAKAVEGDGSAWDTTCNNEIRSIVENPVLRHIFEILADYGVLPSTWMEEHSLACEQKKLRLFFTNKFETMSVTIDAIRRSGHRGTSCLNWWMNFVLWVSSVFKEPERFLDVNVKKGEDLTGVLRWWSGAFEGDDSLCTMKPPMVDGDDLSKVFLTFWADVGFNMKIVFCTTRATFVGWNIGCVEGELTDYRCPELPRALANSGVSVSVGAIDAAKKANRKSANVLAAASALARASDFSGILPSVSEKYLEYAESVSSSNFEDREMSIRSYGEDGHGADEVRAMIRERNVGVTPQEEGKVLDALGYSATPDEIASFREYVWSMDPHVLTDYASFKESLPPSWRTA